MQRRQLLKLGGVFAGLGLAANGFSAPENTTLKVTSESSFLNGLNQAEIEQLKNASWAEIRQLFQFAHSQLNPGPIPLNAANLCPSFTHVNHKLFEYSQLLDNDVSFINRRDFVLDKVELARTKMAKLLGIDNSDDIAFVRNTSEANATIINGLKLKSQDEVIIWDQNHATNNRSWGYRSEQQPFNCKLVILPELNLSEEGIIKSFTQKLTSNTRVVSFSHLSNLSGLTIPAKKLCAAIHQYNPDIFIHIDGAQSLGCLDLNLSDIDCDSFSSSCHKWLMGPRGTGILYVKEKWAKKITPNILAYDFTFDYPEESLAQNAKRFECLGQRDTAAYGAISDAIDLHLAIGPKRIENRIQALTQYTIHAYKKANISLASIAQPDMMQGVVVVDLGNQWAAYGAFLALANEGMASAFVHGYDICCDRINIENETEHPVYLRICPHIYNSEADIDKAVAIVKRVKESKLEIIKEAIKFL